MDYFIIIFDLEFCLRVLEVFVREVYTIFEVGSAFLGCSIPLRKQMPYSMDGPVGFLRFGEGTLAICGPGSSRIVKFQWNLKVLKPE